MPSHHRRSSLSFNPNLTPLLDVVLQLITFFMMLVHFSSRLEGANKAIRLPIAPAALPGSDLTFDRLTVTMDAQGRLQDGGQWLGEEMASTWWAQQAQIRREGLKAIRGNGPSIESDELPTIVILRADRTASYGSVRRALAAAQDQGFAHFSLIVLRRHAR